MILLLVIWQPQKAADLFKLIIGVVKKLQFQLETWTKSQNEFLNYPKDEKQ